MSEKVLMKGNEAIAEAAILAGCRHYLGYPITPQTEIAAYMGITRQGVRDNIKRGEKQLLSYESEIGLAGRFAKVSALCDIIGSYVEKLSKMELGETADEYLTDISYNLKQIEDIV